MRYRLHAAFTLVEMMAVVIIIGILAAIIAPKFFKQTDQAKINAAKTTLLKVESAIEMYRMQTSKFPEDLRDLVKEPEGVKGWNGPYLPKVPRDPWDVKLEYSYPGNHDTEYDLYSLGADGQEGGEGPDADITNWDEGDFDD